jgi:hypothetical protein
MKLLFSSAAILLLVSGCGRTPVAHKAVSVFDADTKPIKQGFDAAFEKMLRDYPPAPQDKTPKSASTN